MKPACIHDPEQRELALKFIICPLCLSERMGHLEAALAAARAIAFRDDCACVECGMHAGDRDRMTADLAAARQKIVEYESHGPDGHNVTNLQFHAVRHELEAERIEVAHLREAFVTMERAANQHEADLAAARAVLDGAYRLPRGTSPDHAIHLCVNEAAWLTWQARKT